MRIQRSRSRLTFRTRRRRSGCLPLTFLLMALVGIGFLSRGWLDENLNGSPSGSATADLQNANEAFDRGDLDTAVNLSRQVWNNQPDSIDALALLVRSLIYRSYTDYNRDIDRTVALQVTLDAIEWHPDDLRVQALHAYALQAAGQSEEAWNLARQVLRQDETNQMARMALSLANAQVGGYENALREAETLNTLPDAGLDARRVLAITLADVGRYDEARAAVEEAIALNNRLLVLYFEQALYALQTGDFNAATAAYFRIMAFDSDNVKVRLRMCELSSLLSERETALDYCRQVTEAAPRWTSGWHALGREYFFAGDFLEAQHSLNRCTSLAVANRIPIDDKLFECWYLQGQAAEILGDCDGLLATYREFQSLSGSVSLKQTWTYPPEGPEICGHLN